MSHIAQYLGDSPLDEASARRRALEWIRAFLGQTPYVAAITLEGDVWRVKIDAELPKVLFNPLTSKPHRALYYHFRDVGSLSVDAHDGDIVSKPDFWVVSKNIESELREVRTSIEKALTRVAAVPFSRLPFGEHMHTPLNNILSWLLLEHEFHFAEGEEVDVGGVPVKVADYVARLEKVGLVRVEGTTALPGNELVEIFARPKPDHERMRDAMAFFFARGFGDIDSIRQVLGPYLRLSSIIYEDSVEVGERLPISYANVKQRLMETSYGRGKEFALPRYLLQLSEVGLIDSGTEQGERTFMPNDSWYQKVLSQEELLEPVRQAVARDVSLL